MYYYIEKDRHPLRFSQGLNQDYFRGVSIHGVKEAKKRNKEREQIALQIINQVKEWIENREFDPGTKAFKLPENEVSLNEYLDKFFDYKCRESISPNTLKQYKAKLNSFKDYLNKRGKKDIKLKEAGKDLYVDYFQEIKANSRVNWHNGLLIFHRMFYKWLTDIEEVQNSNPTKIIRTLPKEDIVMHKAINRDLVAESFDQIERYGSNILRLMCEFIFYTLHRPNTLVQIQRKDIDLKNGTINISASIIKTGKGVILKLHDKLLEILNSYLLINEVHPDWYLFGYDRVESIRGTKRGFSLFASEKSNETFYSQKFQHFVNEQIVKAYKSDESIPNIFFSGSTTLYGYKHSGVVFLRNAGWTLEQIIQLTGHKDTDIVKWYGREYKPTLPAFPSL